MYFHADDLIKQNPEIKAIVVSGNPFIQFRFAYHLNKRHKSHGLQIIEMPGLQVLLITYEKRNCL